MANLTKSLLDAISIIANKTVDEISSDKTIKAIVKKVVSTSEGKYLVTYNSGDFYAYVQPGSTDLYEIGEHIYILVPEGDMSQKKFIIGKAKRDEKFSSSKVLTSSLLNDYVMLGNNAVIENTYSKDNDIYIKRMQPLSLNSEKINDFYYCYLKDSSELSEEYNTYNYPCVNIDEEVFSNSVKQAEALLIRAKFKASINSDYIGNYGIIVNIAFADETNPQTDDDGNVIYDDDGNVIYSPKLIAYVLDTSKMTGNPMKFYDYTSQYIVAAFNGEKYLYIDSIVAFSEGFVDSNLIIQGQTGETGDVEDINNIWIDGLEIIALDEISAINGDYKLKLTAPKGNTIKTGQRNSLKIIAETSYLDKDITKNTIFYWGIKDPSITSTNNNYHAKIGSGYRYLDVGNKNEILLNPAILSAAENVFTCVAVYESNIILRTSISMYNNNNKLDITIDSDQGTSFQFNEGNPTLTCLINGKTSNYQDTYPDSAFSFIWSQEDEELGTVILNKTKAQLEAEKEQELAQCKSNGISNSGRTILQVLSYYSTQIAQVQNVSFPDGVRGSKINCKLKNINTTVTYSCSVYRGDVYIGYASIILQNSKKVINNNYYVTITNGTQVFQYDESGTAPNSQRQDEPIDVLDLIAVFHSPQGAEVTPKKVRWIIPTGKTLINLPSLGLEIDSKTGERCFVGSTFPLRIKDIYDNNCNDNQVIAVVTHADGTEYRQSSNLLFTKIGEIGTNGTDTVVKIDEYDINVSKDEYLTIIKSGDSVKYNNSNDNDNINNDIMLQANLYTNNTQVLGHKTKWTIAGTSNTQARNYEVITNEDNNTCTISYNGDENQLDTRIVRAQTSLQGKYFYSFYGIPAIEYQKKNNDEYYSYEEYPIKVMRDGTLKSVLYDSNGTNPSYNQTQGVHVELPNWEETGYLEWEVESGVLTNNIEYENPNFLLAKSSKAKKGSKILTRNSDTDNIKTNILETQDNGRLCAEKASSNIKKYINEFLIDIEKIGTDNILSTRAKIEALWNRLAKFKDEAEDKENIYIKTVYEKYYDFFQIINNEYDSCKDINKACTETYDNIQAIWKSEWPGVITENRLSVKSDSEINDIYELIQRYQQAYDDRSNEVEEIGGENSIIEIPDRIDTFSNDFQSLLENMDNSYNEYISQENIQISLNSILIEYAKVLVAYLKFLVEETQNCFMPTDSNSSSDFNNNYEDMVKKYDAIYEDWVCQSGSNISGNVYNITIGENIYNAVNFAEEIAANVYDNIRELYNYYQSLYLNIKKYQIAEESETLLIWNAMLNGQEPDLLNQIYIVPNDTFNGLYMNNNVVGTAFIIQEDEKIEIAKIYVPIIMTLNTYELAALNGWDGTSLEIGEDHIMTPQIGAGVKDDTTNTFTGMVMGVIGNTKTDVSNFKKKTDKNEKIGLVGYSEGQQSVFIDSKTGKATFGLPSDDTNTSEGRIELVPGGVSKIGNWKIGNRFLYNVIGGSYEKRKDNDARGSDKNRLMVPHDKHGIILSSNKPYIHVKGEVYADNNLSGINYEDEYNNINPGDSLELRMDPGNSSLFSIIQHTTGFGNENIDNLYFGYKISNSNIPVVKDYKLNQNIEELSSQTEAEYYIYTLATDNKGNYQSYYKEDNNNILTYTQETENFSIINGEKFLKDALPEESFKRTVENNNIPPVFICDEETGIISYNPDNLIWNIDTNQVNESEVIGLSNNDDWRSITEETVSGDGFSVDFKYNKDIYEPINNNLVIGQIVNTFSDILYKIKILNYKLNYKLEGIDLNNSINSSLQFYIVLNEEDEIEEALLKSEIFSFWNDQNIDIDLYSVDDNQGLFKDIPYYLKVKLFIEEYSINADCSYFVKNDIKSSYKVLPDPIYGIAKLIDGRTGYSIQFTAKTDDGNNSVFGRYTLREENGLYKFYFILRDSSVSQSYDFILWREGMNDVIAGGRTNGNSYAKFFTTTDTLWKDLNGFKDELNYPPPSEENPWYISFYPEGYLTIETTSYEIQQTSLENNQDNIGTTEGSDILDSPDNTNNVIVENLLTITKYRLINSSVIDMINKNLYKIKWSEEEELEEKYYNNIKTFWNFLVSFNFDNILGSTPWEDDSLLCVKEENGIASLQGIPYAKTYWVGNEEKPRVRFYRQYYDWVNLPNNTKEQYGYIDIVKNNNINNDIYYKYIRTLKKKNINDWFEGNDSNEINHSEENSGLIFNWIEINSQILNQLSYWKEFIRVGLDENGRFFSAGLQDKRTYSRTGIIHGFGKVPNLYGQEIRAQISSNSYLPVLKIFSQKTNSNMDTTYITQGQNDKGNISVRTAENGYIELGASQYSNNNNNLIPNTINFIRISYKDGINFNFNNNKIELNKNLSVKTNSMVMNFINNENKNIIQYKIDSIDNQSIQIKTPRYFISSSSLKGSLIGDTNDKDDYGHYRINAFIDSTNQKKEPKIQLQVGKKNVGLNISSNEIELKGIDGYSFKINELGGAFSFGRYMGLNFNIDNNIISLNNKRTILQVIPDSIKIFSNLNTTGIIVSNKVEIKSSNIIDIGNKIIVNKNNVYVKNVPLCLNNDLYIGYDGETKQSFMKTIRLYKEPKNGQNRYITISADLLYQIFDWYNNYRWAMAVNGNTLMLKEINPNVHEGGYINFDSTGMHWNYKTFSGQWKTGDWS